MALSSPLRADQLTLPQQQAKAVTINAAKVKQYLKSHPSNEEKQLQCDEDKLKQQYMEIHKKRLALKKARLAKK